MIAIHKLLSESDYSLTDFLGSITDKVKDTIASFLHKRINAFSSSPLGKVANDLGLVTKIRELVDDFLRRSCKSSKQADEEERLKKKNIS